MGFLKDLFEKKLKTSRAFDGDDDGAGVEVARSAQSAWSLPAHHSSASASLSGSGSGAGAAGAGKLRPGGDARDGDSAALLSPSLAAGGGAGALAASARAPEQSAKSFTQVAVRRAACDAADRAAAAAAARRAAGPGPPGPGRGLRYESIGQFSQKVEVYRGSVATVYKAVCLASGSRVVIKAYHKAKMAPKHHVKLAREIDAMRALAGPTVAELYDAFEDASSIYLVIESCEGGDLFKAMLLHGGLLDEAWVCVEVIAPLLRTLERMHALGMIHRDIKPENIFLTGAGRFKLGDFGLAIRFKEELPFSRSGTLDYMAPEVLKNPSVQLQESRSVDAAALTARGVRPYGPSVDVWAAGVLAYELVVGRPPFEVEDEAQTAALIMYSDAVRFPPNRSAAWADFVRAALVKSPDARPTAAVLLQHPWVVANMQRAINERHRPSKEMLMSPLPLLGAHDEAQLDAMTAGAAAAAAAAAPTALSEPGFSSRGSGAASAPLFGSGAAAAADGGGLAPLPTGGFPSVAASLPAACPATPTGAARSHAHNMFCAAGGAEHHSSSSTVIAHGSSHADGSLHADGSATPRSRLSGLGAGSIGSGSGKRSPSPAGGEEAAKPARSAGSFTGSAPSPLNPAVAGARTSIGSGGSGSGSPSFAQAPRRPGLQVTLPTDADAAEHSSWAAGGSSDMCASPSTPVPRPGIKGRMEFYFKRQAGGL